MYIKGSVCSSLEKLSVSISKQNKQKLSSGIFSSSIAFLELLVTFSHNLSSHCSSHTTYILITTYLAITMATEVTKATPTCCGRNSGDECVCGKKLSQPVSSLYKNPQHTFTNHSQTIDTDAFHATAKQATCSCGKQSALHCTCQRATTENTLSGARCSCRARPAGQCTCDRAAKENAAPPSDNVCQCGARPADSCTCERAATAADQGPNPNEIDFTTRK
ncbi:hypothetical protein GGR55DRAFT_638356 [Xylaria sp. FL0064]|nr:hypothetical protein GGR55DRAFT_638356 [Xylaria sp. FL0064]